MVQNLEGIVYCFVIQWKTVNYRISIINCKTMVQNLEGIVYCFVIQWKTVNYRISIINCKEMVRTCFLCKWRSNHLPQRSFHQFPSKDELKQKWLEILGLCNVSLGKHTALCSLHFEEDCFCYGAVCGKKYLKQGSLPTLYLTSRVQMPLPTTDDVQMSHQTSDLENENHAEDNAIEVPMEICTPTESSSISSSIRGSLDLKDKYVLLKKQVDTLKRKVNRLYKSKDVWKTKCKRLKTTDHSNKCEGKLLQDKLGPIPQALYLTLTSKKKRIPTYSTPLRVFASTLSYLSSKAYRYIRKIFPNLPHEATLRKWLREIELKPGICEPSLTILKKKSILAKNVGKQLLCNLTVDDMAIRTHVRWTGKTFKGFVTYRKNPRPENHHRARAKYVMVVMMVCLNEHWKLPVAYHFIDSLYGSDRATIINDCLKRIHVTGIDIVGLTFDGGSSNITMARNLGANMVRNNFIQWFPHPVTKTPIYVLLDACHAIKLVRNAISFYKHLYDGDGNLVAWEYFKKLVNVQQEYGLHAGTKIRQRHINYYHEKMKVRLATQLLSRSVSNALEFLRTSQSQGEFEGSFGTEQFCLIMNDVFDFLNSRQAYCKIPSKRCINKHNFDEMTLKVSKYESYIKGVHTGNEHILQSNRWLGFYGLIVSMRSALAIFDKYGMTECPSLKYLLTYKLSQDHLELFFCNVRSRGGQNNNPTVEQFEAALKWLLLYADVQGSESGNCVTQDHTCLLTSTHKEQSNISSSAQDTSQGKELIDEDTVLTEHNYSLPNIFLNHKHRAYIEEVVAHIAGFIARRVAQLSRCNECRNLLKGANCLSALQRIKNMGRLTSASEDVVNILQLAERICRNVSCSLFTINHPKTTLKEMTISHIPTTCLQHGNGSDHRLKLINQILDIFFNIRLHHATITDFPEEERIRSKHVKTILFCHQ